MLLNEADAIYLGSAAADKAYLGEVLVWPMPVMVLQLSKNYVDGNARLVGLFSTTGGLAPYTYTLEE